jgi:hypothetical protein
MNWETARNIITSLSAAVAIVAALWKLPPMIRRWWDRRTLLELSGEAWSADDARRYTRYYIEPDCQSVDPSGLEDFRRIVPTRVPLFSAMDRILERAKYTARHPAYPMLSPRSGSNLLAAGKRSAISPKPLPPAT